MARSMFEYIENIILRFRWSVKTIANQSLWTKAKMLFISELTFCVYSVWIIYNRVRCSNLFYIDIPFRCIFHISLSLVYAWWCLSEHTRQVMKVPLTKYFSNKPNIVFSILDTASSSSFQLKIKEALHIHWEKPTLNRQIFHVNLSLAI